MLHLSVKTFDVFVSGRNPCQLMHYGKKQVMDMIVGINEAEYLEVLYLGPQPPVSTEVSGTLTGGLVQVPGPRIPSVLPPDLYRVAGVHGKKPLPPAKELKAVVDEECFALGFDNCYQVAQMKAYLALNGGYSLKAVSIDAFTSHLDQIMILLFQLIDTPAD